MRMAGLVCALALCAGAWAQPVIDPGGVQNAGGYQNQLAPGAIFVVKGRGLGGAALAQAMAPDYPAALGGTSVSLTPAAGGTAVAARMVYTLASQIAAVLPSSTAPGVYAVRVSYNGQTSAAQNVTVAARSFGIITADSSGSGPAQATIGNVNGGISLVRFATGSVAFGGYDWTLSPAHPGDTLVFWGTGGGADAANDAGGSSGDQTAAGNFEVVVNGRSITPLYAGTSAGYPGLWQINFTLPADVETGCFAQAFVRGGGQTSNVVTIAIAPAGAGACLDPSLSPESLAKLMSGGKIVGGAFAVIRAFSPGVTQEFASGFIGSWTAAQWAAGASTRPARGACGVYERSYPLNGFDPSSPERFLDLGASLPLAGPGLAGGAALAPVNTPIGPSYQFFPAPGTFATGRYTLRGNGGADVGAFTAGANFPGNFSVTNWDQITAVDRSRPYTVTWTGAGVDEVTLLVTNSRNEGANIHIVSIQCWVAGAAGTFTIPATTVGRLLPPPAQTAISAQGYHFELFETNLTAGGKTDFASFAAGLSYSKSVPVQ